MMRYAFILLFVFSHAFPATSQKDHPLYLDLPLAMAQCGETADALNKIIKTSDAIAQRMGCSFVYYWQPQKDSHFIDITQRVIDEVSGKRSNA